MVLFIGGASRSGKTTVAKKLSGVLNLPLVNLDSMDRDLFKTGGQIKFFRDRRTKTACARMVSELIKVNADCIVEGGWMDPEIAAKLYKSGAFHPAYCGYAGADPKDRLALYKANTSDNWFDKLPDGRALKWIKQQISGSRWYEKECARLNIPYFDFTDISAGSTGLVGHFTKLKESGAE